ncbi:hypothetical protein M758_6G027300 [Ceratodon purpureus]|uniref:Uncharacterized protein n=1 Tax=Ceratodon purpureus TaxID=3225 RepID=A0A8T0H9K0_CERPU|nr:hypothetical protein KC19_6G030300 [Ceratodon purpureus]KAG0612432.1 hypothetical protein M758_6G027300 [Ceratodon purpureus]
MSWDHEHHAAIVNTKFNAVLLVSPFFSDPEQFLAFHYRTRATCLLNSDYREKNCQTRSSLFLWIASPLPINLPRSPAFLSLEAYSVPLRNSNVGSTPLTASSSYQ